MSSLEIADAKAALEKQLAVLELIEQSRQRCLIISGSSFYSIFGNKNEKKADLYRQLAITQRLTNYFINLQKSNFAHV